MNWHHTVTFDYPQKLDTCLVETSDSYKLLWYDKRIKWWFDCGTSEHYDDNTKNFKWVYLADILENIE